MPSYLRELSRSVCWNCDRDADETITVSLRSSTGEGASFALCRRCYEADYVPLAARAEELGAATCHGDRVLVLTRPGDQSAPA